MTADIVLPPKEYFEKYLSYDPETGELTWLWHHDHKHRSRLVGTFVRTVKAGYRRVILNRVFYPAHRVAWLFAYGVWPSHEIDHINGCRSDNRLCNLRDVPHKDNTRNVKRPRTNTSGRVGVRYHQRLGTWYACIMVNKKSVYLGSFKTFEQACAARKAGEKAYGFHENHGRAH